MPASGAWAPADSGSDPATGAACYQLGDLSRLTGELSVAEEHYRQANRLGRRPQPGLALLRLAQGQADTAAVAIRAVADLPSPAARFGCQPHVSGTDGGHDIDLRGLAREGVRLYGRFELVTGSSAQFSDDLAARLAAAARGFDRQFKPLLDAYIAAAGIDAPPDDRPPPDNVIPTHPPGAEPRRREHRHGPVGHRLPARLRVAGPARAR